MTNRIHDCLAPIFSVIENFPRTGVLIGNLSVDGLKTLIPNRKTLNRLLTTQSDRSKPARKTLRLNSDQDPQNKRDVFHDVALPAALSANDMPDFNESHC
jgi:hypothetical protein